MRVWPGPLQPPGLQPVSLPQAQDTRTVPLLGSPQAGVEIGTGRWVRGGMEQEKMESDARR